MISSKLKTVNSVRCGGHHDSDNPEVCLHVLPTWRLYGSVAKCLSRTTFCRNEQTHANQQHVGLPPEITQLLCCADVIADCNQDNVCFTDVLFIFLYSFVNVLANTLDDICVCTFKCMSCSGWFVKIQPLLAISINAFFVIQLHLYKEHKATFLFVGQGSFNSC